MHGFLLYFSMTVTLTFLLTFVFLMANQQVYQTEIQPWIPGNKDKEPSETIRKLYLDQYPSLLKNGSTSPTDETVLELLSIGIRRKLPYLLTLRDSYTRYQYKLS